MPSKNIAGDTLISLTQFTDNTTKYGTAYKYHIITKYCLWMFVELLN